MRKLSYLTVSSVALCASLGMATAKAQESAPQANAGIADIVVTAQKRGENLQNVPIAITALSSEALQAKGISSVQDLVQATPNLNQAPYPTAGSAVLFLFMRGMGAGDPNQVTKDAAIGFYENGIFNVRPTSVLFDLLDPERVEILRGPQGTLYGRNTTGGAINVISRAPSGELGLRQLASYASRNEYRSVTNLDLPAFANIAIKGTLAIGGRDGYQKNVEDPSVPDSDNDFGLNRHVAGRVAARWTPSDDFTADYSFQLGKVSLTNPLFTTPALEGLPLFNGLTYHAGRYQSYRPVALPLSHMRFRDHGLSLEWRASDALTLRSLTGIRRSHQDTFGDVVETYFVPIGSTNDTLSHTFSQEFQAVGTGWDNRVKYALGLYYFRERVSHLKTFIVGSFMTDPTVFGISIFDIRARSISKAAYAQATITPPILDDRLDLTVGVRQTYDKRRAARDLFVRSGLTAASPLLLAPDISQGATQVENDLSNNDKFKRFNPAATIAYRWTDNINTYAKVATGYRAGGSNEDTVAFTETFGPENLTSYEIGFKGDFFDRRLRTNIAAFYNKYKDIQLDLQDPNNQTITNTFNAGKATLKGVEAEITAVFTPALTVNVNYAYLHTKVSEVITGPGQPNIANLFRIPYAPKHSVNVSADLTALRSTEGDLTIHADYNYKSATFGTSGSGAGVPGYRLYRMPSYSEVNARISLERHWLEKPMTISLFAKNLLDKEYIIYRSAAGGLGGFSHSNDVYSAPRTIGVEVSFGL